MTSRSADALYEIFMEAKRNQLKAAARKCHGDTEPSGNGRGRAPESKQPLGWCQEGSLGVVILEPGFKKGEESWYHRIPTPCGRGNGRGTCHNRICKRTPSHAEARDPAVLLKAVDPAAWLRAQAKWPRTSMPKTWDVWALFEHVRRKHA